MAEYVTKEQVIDWFRPYGHFDEPISFETLVSDLRGMKPADVAPVRHGRWDVEWDAERDQKRLFVRIVCSNCGLKTGQKSNYCPSCGAKMDLGDGEE